MLVYELYCFEKEKKRPQSRLKFEKFDQTQIIIFCLWIDLLFAHRYVFIFLWVGVRRFMKIPSIWNCLLIFVFIDSLLKNHKRI